MYMLYVESPPPPPSWQFFLKIAILIYLLFFLWGPWGGEGWYMQILVKLKGKPVKNTIWFVHVYLSLSPKSLLEFILRIEAI